MENRIKFLRDEAAKLRTNAKDKTKTDQERAESGEKAITMSNEIDELEEEKYQMEEEYQVDEEGNEIDAWDPDLDENDQGSDTAYLGDDDDEEQDAFNREAGY